MLYRRLKVMMNPRSFSGLMLALLLCLPAWLPAQDAPDKPAQDTKPDARQMALEMLQGRKTDEKPKSFDDIIKDMEKIEGIFTLYHKKNDLYMEIDPAQLDKLYLLQCTFNTGTSEGRLVAGHPINDYVIRLQKVNEQVQFVLPNIQFRAKDNDPVARAVKRSFADSVLAAFKIEATHPERNTLLVKVDTLLLSDFNRVASRLATGGGVYTVDKDKTFFDSVKAFPLNMVLTVHYTFHNPSPVSLPANAPVTLSRALIDSRSAAIKVTYNLFALPVDNGYQARLYDPRVGYFTADHTDFSRGKSEDQVVRYILRWHIEKSDPNAPLSPPKQPIVFWLDNAIPVEYRDAIKEGILMWNKAFERVGIKDAIQVHQMPDDADWDHSDMRYNILRWVTSPSSGYAVAWFRENPLTGQILNASITFDANMARFSNVEWDQIVTNVQGLSTAGSGLRASDEADLHQDPYYHRYCNYAVEKRNDAAFGYMALELLESVPINNREDYVKQYLKETAAHEMGHILGLRHNFIASTMLTMEEAQDMSITGEKGVCASVMDYNPSNIALPGMKQGDFFNTTIGLYDIWAIEYGYMFVNAKDPEGELPRLKQHASQSHQPGLAFATDEDTVYDLDPRVNRFDLGTEPMVYAKYRMDLAKRLWARAEIRYPEQGESYAQFRRSFTRALSAYSNAAIMPLRYIGGVYVERNFRGDPNEKLPMRPVEGSKQREALAIVRQYVLDENAMRFSPTTLQKLAVDYTAPRGSGTALRPEFPALSVASGLQQIVITRLFSPQVLSRVQENELRATNPKDTLTMPELFREVYQAVWTEVSAGRNVGLLRRQLQRAHLAELVKLTASTSNPLNGDARLLAMRQLRQLQNAVTKALENKKLDDYTRLHFEDIQMQIKKAFEARTGADKPATGAGSGE